jgi:bifunctional non-homologous end joining protein LigD
MGLRTYRAKRRFDVTPEPRGAAPPKRATTRGLHFVVHKHRASHLHYDLRLESDGVLHSWAVPKGPSLDPSVKRLAMMVEDHPVEYRSFEGTIPENEYGGGTMMLWDRGVWTPDEPAVARSIARGELKFSLDGEKLSGSWVLVRTGGRGNGRSDQRSWLLIKHRDEAASEADVAESAPYSVATGRLLAQIAHDEGGDVAKAASGDPPAAVERLLGELRAEAATAAARKSPRKKTMPPLDKPKVARKTTTAKATARKASTSVKPKTSRTRKAS